MAVVYILEPGAESMMLGIVGLLASAIFIAYLRYVDAAYVKTSAEGIEQRIWFSNPTRYPFNAINRVVFYKAAKYEDEDMVGFYAKSGTQIALFSPLPHKNYRLLAIVRFRIENERWPDMDNPDDVAQVNHLDCAGKTMRYFENLGKVTDLAERLHVTNHHTRTVNVQKISCRNRHQRLHRTQPPQRLRSSGTAAEKTAAGCVNFGRLYSGCLSSVSSTFQSRKPC